MFLTTKLFQCSCLRCSDPSELDLNLNNILCDICKKYFSPDQQSRIQSECEQQSRNIISGGSSACNNELELVEKLSKILSHDNYLILQCKQTALHHADSCSDCRNNHAVSKIENDVNCFKHKVFKTILNIGIKFK